MQWHDAPDFSWRDMAEEKIRLNKYLSEAGVCSRREADRLLEQGEVTVDGRRAFVGASVAPGQSVAVKGKPVKREQRRVLLALYKPRGVVCTTDRRWKDKTIEDILDYPGRVFPVGRLDKESEGLLLLTNDGDLQDRISRARYGHEKEYLVTVDRPVTEAFLTNLEKGVYLPELERTTRPCRVQKKGEYQFSIVLTQGLNRQIRRMCQAFHYRVRRLVRLRVMNILLGELRPGEYREVKGLELEQLTRALTAEQGREKPYGTAD